MTTAAWVGAAWLAWVVSGAAARYTGMGHVFPDVVVVFVVFMALRRDAVSVAVAALALGYLVGRQELAPTGLFSFALLVTAIGTQIVAGHLAASGALFFAFVSGAVVVAYHALLFVLLYVFRGEAGFASWATALFVPTGLATMIAALVFHPMLCWLDRRLTPEQRQELSWR